MNSKLSTVSRTEEAQIRNYATIPEAIYILVNELMACISKYASHPVQVSKVLTIIEMCLNLNNQAFKEALQTVVFDIQTITLLTFEHPNEPLCPTIHETARRIVHQITNVPLAIRSSASLPNGPISDRYISPQKPNSIDLLNLEFEEETVKVEQLSDTKSQSMTSSLSPIPRGSFMTPVTDKPKDLADIFHFEEDATIEKGTSNQQLSDPMDILFIGNGKKIEKNLPEEQQLDPFSDVPSYDPFLSFNIPGPINFTLPPSVFS